MKLLLNKVRTEKQMTIRDLSEKANVAKSHIEKIESGQANPTIDVLCRLANALDAPVNSLFTCD